MNIGEPGFAMGPFRDSLDAMVNKTCPFVVVFYPNQLKKNTD